VTDLDLTVLYLLILRTHNKFVRKNEMLAFGVCCSFVCSSVYPYFASSSWLGSKPFVCLFVYLFVCLFLLFCCNKTQNLYSASCWEGSKPPGNDHTRAEVQNPWMYIHSGRVTLPAVLPKVHHRTETLHVPTKLPQLARALAAGVQRQDHVWIVTD